MLRLESFIAMAATVTYKRVWHICQLE